MKNRHPEMSLRNRLIEVAVTGVASIVTSALVTSWWLSAKLATFESGIRMNTDAISTLSSTLAQNRTQISSVEGVNSTQTAQIAVGDARWVEVQGRLGRIENKVDSLASSRR